MLNDFFWKKVNLVCPHLEHDYAGINSRVLVEYFEIFMQRVFFDFTIKDLENDAIPFTYLKDYRRFVALLTQAIPLEYIVEKKFFYKSEFRVNKSVLIPRFETEILVEMAYKFLSQWKKNNKESSPSICDIGTGSGVIVLSLLCECDFAVHAQASDISDEALIVARHNYFYKRFSIHPSSILKFIRCDRMQGVKTTFDLIISNPPYIKRNSDAGEVHSSVIKFEPDIALFLNDTEYDLWFEIFLKQAYDLLNKNGVMMMEGHEDHLEELLLLALLCGFNRGEITDDYTHRSRFITLWK